MEDLVRRKQIPDVALWALSSEDSYVGMDNDFERRGWWAVVVSDVMEDIRSMILANAVDVDAALETFETEWRGILAALQQGAFPVLQQQLQQTAGRLQALPLKLPVQRVPVVTLTGEIFVRRDALSRQHLTERLAERGFATICSPVAEWVLYCNYMVDTGLNPENMGWLQKIRFKVRNKYQAYYERKIKSALSASGLVDAGPIDIRELIENARPLISPNLPGEAVLTVGGSLTEIVSHSCGVIAIGPFGCMPNRLSEAILNETMTGDRKLASDPGNPSLKAVLTGVTDLPFLAIESDGSPFPQLINAKLEAFCLQAERLHRRKLSGGEAA
jgi:predicted nucleotide-binding protein (sugar kinase/HSP70/actin superfamily)